MKKILHLLMNVHVQLELIYIMIVMAPITSGMSTMLNESDAWDLISIPSPNT